MVDWPGLDPSPNGLRFQETGFGLMNWGCFRCICTPWLQIHLISTHLYLYRCVLNKGDLSVRPPGRRDQDPWLVNFCPFRVTDVGEFPDFPFGERFTRLCLLMPKREMVG